MSELHVVALSGGKDSTAMALRLRELNPTQPYEYVCTPTGDELDEMFDHWKMLGKMLGKKIKPVMHELGLNGLIEAQQALPNWRQRWCTKDLKIKPYAKWLRAQCEKFDEVYSYVGLRADEEEREGGDYANISGVVMRFPMRDWGWTLDNVTSYLEDKKVTIPDRTDCARCFFQRLGEWWMLWKHHPDKYEHAAEQERRIGYTFRSPGRDTWPAALDDLRKEFESGRTPRGIEGDALANLKCRVCRI